MNQIYYYYYYYINAFLMSNKQTLLNLYDHFFVTKLFKIVSSWNTVFFPISNNLLDLTYVMLFICILLTH